MRIHICPCFHRFHRFHREKPGGEPNPQLLPGKGAPPRELGEEQGKWPAQWKKKAWKFPPPLFTCFQSGQGQPERAGNGHISIGPFPLVICTVGKLRLPLSLRKLQGLIDLLESILFTHNPTWDDCQQLLQVLFTTEEHEQILLEARKNVPGVDGRPIVQPNLIEEGFPLVRPNWDFECAEGRESLRVYRQTHGRP